MTSPPMDISGPLDDFNLAVKKLNRDLARTHHKVTRTDPSPGDVGRFAIHTHPQRFATELAGWCGDSVELNDVAAWMDAVAKRLREIRESM